MKKTAILLILFITFITTLFWAQCPKAKPARPARDRSVIRPGKIKDAKQKMADAKKTKKETEKLDILETGSEEEFYAKRKKILESDMCPDEKEKMLKKLFKERKKKLLKKKADLKKDVKFAEKKIDEFERKAEDTTGRQGLVGTAISTSLDPTGETKFGSEKSRYIVSKDSPFGVEDIKKTKSDLEIYRDCHEGWKENLQIFNARLSDVDNKLDELDGLLKETLQDVKKTEKTKEAKKPTKAKP